MSLHSAVEWSEYCSCIIDNEGELELFVGQYIITW